MATNKQKLDEHLNSNPNKHPRSLHYASGTDPNVTQEQVYGEILRSLKAIDAGDYEKIDSIDGLGD